MLSLPHPPTAIWAINDLLAIGALRAIHERRLCVPTDVALAGFDDIAFAQQLYPPLTTVHMPSRRMGRRAAEFLFRRIADPEAPLMQETLPLQLIVRASTVSAV